MMSTIENLLASNEFWLHCIPKLSMAILCGALIGFERERKGKSAGFRTNLLICSGATLYTLVSVMLARSASGQFTSDPGRIAAQVVTGVGFIGAGTIIQSRGTVRGLTTAATIWIVAAIGVAIGAGYLLLGLVSTILIVIVLSLLVRVEKWMMGTCDYAPCKVIFEGDTAKVKAMISEAFEECQLSMEKFTLVKEGSLITLTGSYCVSHQDHRKVLEELWRLDEVREIHNQSE